MIYVEINVAKNKHNYLITNSDGIVLFNPFTIPSNHEGFEILYIIKYMISYSYY